MNENPNVNSGNEPQLNNNLINNTSLNGVNSNNSVSSAGQNTSTYNSVLSNPVSQVSTTVISSNTTPNFNLKNNNLKKIIIALLVLVAGICIFIYFKSNGSNDKKSAENLNAIFDPNKPIIIHNNNKYGYISSEGKVLIEPKYREANEFYGNYAIIKTDNPDNKLYIDEVYQIIDNKGNVKIQSSTYTKPRYYSEYDVWVVDKVLYNSNLKKILNEGITVDYIELGFFGYNDSKKNETGIINYKGEKIFTWSEPSIYVSISEPKYDSEEIYAEIYSTNKQQNDLVVSLTTGDVLFTSKNKNLVAETDGIFTYSDIDDYGTTKYLYFAKNKLVYQSSEKVQEITVYDYKNQILKIDYGYDYDASSKKDIYDYFDVKKEKILETKPSYTNSANSDEDLMELTYGYKTFESKGNFGLMSGDKIVIPSEYDNVELLSSSLFKYIKQKKKQEIVKLEKGDTTILMDINSKKVIATFDAWYVTDVNDSTFVKAHISGENTSGDKIYVIYNLLTGSSKTISKDEEVTIYSNYITIRKNGKTFYYNTKFKEIYVEEN